MPLIQYLGTVNHPFAFLDLKVIVLGSYTQSHFGAHKQYMPQSHYFDIFKENNVHAEPFKEYGALKLSLLAFSLSLTELKISIKIQFFLQYLIFGLYWFKQGFK